MRKRTLDPLPDLIYRLWELVMHFHFRNGQKITDQAKSVNLFPPAGTNSKEH